MNVKILFCTILFLIRIQLSGQEAKNNLTISSGIILDDGFVYRPSVPVMGLGYSYKLNKFLSVDAGLFSIYKTIGDHTVLGNDPVNIITRNSNSIFISKEDSDRIKNVGIKDLSTDGTVKYLYLPLSLSLNTHPIKIGPSSLGVAIGATLTYGSYKASRDEIPITITLNDGTVYEYVTFKQEIEFRNLILGDSYSRLYYKYTMKKNSLMLSLHSYNFFWSHDNTETNHLLTIDFQSSF
ncbi:MAG: hypothetical protein IPL63_02950 [Saprospiraceae bacterium]|nr:hypothetical protein [Saprospiraceae bacterium]MBK6566762.1 hypothetical protein [Saprospiraceae bacterium]MBK6785436.1 hypothetical protein [Saprospiraceae bacterium]MBK8081752.1 hypothetical protein [Saprospiraceae bacterium]MBK8371224.1 hypothetical protein [Saprospiraceae bacterium]